MNWNQSFVRKVVYVAVMGVLLVPLSLISRPSTPPRENALGDEGGLLARKRTEYNISQVQLGEIDPASETMKLALLGMRGIAANILWTKANHYKKTEEWPKLMATVEQITNLQPNFISVWQFQAWNVSYNVSVEFDNYLHRYYWVKRGIRFLIDGTRFNRDEPRLLWDIGWFFGQKIGRSDEYLQFRREFREDDEFHDFIRQYVPQFNQDCLDRGVPDNWLVSRQWFLIAQETVDSKRATLRGRSLQSIFEENPSEKKRGKSPVLFHSNPAMALINFATAIQEEGTFDEVAMDAWEFAHREWVKYGNREIRTSRDFYIRLYEAEELEAEARSLRQKIADLVPGLENELAKKNRDELSDEQLLAWDTSIDKRTPEQHEIVRETRFDIQVTPRDIANAAPESTQSQIRYLATEIEDYEQRADFVRRYRQIVNYEYWKTRCEVEQLDEANAARKHLYQADKDFREGRLEPAKKEYNLAWNAWANIYDRYPTLREDVGAEDVVDAIKRYATLLGQLDEAFPNEFKLKSLVSEHDRDFRPWSESTGEEENLVSPPVENGEVSDGEETTNRD